MVEKPELIFFGQNKLGGVQNLYYNLICFAPPDVDVRWMLLEVENSADAKPIRPFDLPHEVFKIGATETGEEYSKRLSKLISDQPGAVVTNYFTELVTLELYRPKNKTIYFICHDEAYLDTATTFEFLIDVFIAHNPIFQRKLQELLPGRKEDIFYLPYGIVPSEMKRAQGSTQTIRLLYLGRLNSLKGVFDLMAIDEALQKLNVTAQWTVIGNGPDREAFQNQIRGNSRFKLLTDLPDQELPNYLPHQDVFVLPSRLEGVPLAMLETMSAGIVPVIYRFNEGIEMMFPNVTIVDVGNVQAMAEAIAKLHNDRSLLEEQSATCRSIIHSQFNAKDRSRAYFELFAKYKLHKKPLRRKIAGRLDHYKIPPFIRDFLRRLKTKLQ